jgi:hypothetical protein
MLARAIEATLMYARAQTKLRELKVDRVLLSGGGANLKGLSPFLARRLGAEVAPLQPLRKVSLGSLSPEQVKPLGEEYASLAVPIGLALSRAHERAYRLDLRRQAAKDDRLFRRHDLYLWAAAAVLAAAIVFWVGDALRERGLAARAKETSTSVAKSDRDARREFEIARRRNTRLRAELEALRDRVTSGEDLLRVLSQLKKRTPPSVTLVELSTTRMRLPGDQDGISSAERQGPETFQSDRRIYLRGYATSSLGADRLEAYGDALKIVEAYEEELKEARELFAQVEPQLTLRIEEASNVAAFWFALTVAREQ